MHFWAKSRAGWIPLDFYDYQSTCGAKNRCIAKGMNTNIKFWAKFMNFLAWTKIHGVQLIWQIFGTIFQLDTKEETISVLTSIEPWQCFRNFLCAHELQVSDWYQAWLAVYVARQGRAGQAGWVCVWGLGWAQGPNDGAAHHGFLSS